MPETTPTSEELSAAIESGMRWSVARQAITGVLGTLGAIVYTRLITPEDLGAVGLAILVYNALVLLISAPIRDAVVYHHQDVSSAAFWIIFLLSVLGSLIVVGFAGQFGQFYQSELAVPLTRAIAAAAFFRAMDVVPAALLLKQMRFAELEVLRTVNFILLAIGWTVFALLGFGAWAVVLPHVITSFFLTTAIWIVARFRPELRFQKAESLSVLRFGWSVFGGKLLLYLTRNFDNGAVGSLGERALGFYSLGEDQSEFAAISIAEAVSQVALAALAQLRDRAEDFKRVFLKMLRLLAVISTPMQIGAFVLADLGFAVIFGEQWMGAVPVFRAYLAFRLLDTLAELCDATTSAAGKPQYRFWVNLLQLPFFAGAALFAVTMYGTIEAVAITLAGVRIIATSVYLGITFRLANAGFRDWTHSLAPSSFADAGMGGVILLLRTTALSEYIDMWVSDAFISTSLYFSVMIILGALSYFAMLYVLGPAGFREVIGEYYQIVVPDVVRQRSKLLKWLERVFRISPP